MSARQTIHSGDTFEHKGRTFRLDIERDAHMGEPWKEHDGHGVISDWTRRGKAPGERVLCSDRDSHRYYDVAETMKLARRDGWGCPHTEAFEVNGRRIVWGGHTTPGKVAACAVDADFERMRRWCADDWEWSSARVVLLDDDGDETSEVEYLSGIESDAGAYWDTVARELADEIMARVEVESPDAVLSEN